MKSLIEKILSLPLAAKLLLGVNVGALFFALVMQFGFGFRPCILCLWQRVPYGLVALLSLGTLVWKPYRRQTTLLLGLCGVIYLAGAGLAFFHSGVERQWWPGTDECVVQPLQGASPEEMRQALLQTTMPRCDEIQGTIFGLTMANMNIFAFLGLAFFAVAAMMKHLQVKFFPPFFCLKGKNCHKD